MAVVLLIGFCWSAMFCGTAQSATVYFDDFSGDVGSVLDGLAPDTRLGLATWDAYGSWKADGTSVNPGNANANAWLPFTPTSGQLYSLSLDVNPPTTTSDTWMAIGFSQNASPPLNQSFSAVSSVAWMLNREDDNSATTVQTFLGPNTANGGPSKNTVPAGPVTLKVELDTRPDQWTVEYFVNGTSLRAPTAYATNPSIQSVGFGTSQSSTSGGVVDKFLLTSYAWPPAALQIGSGKQLMFDNKFIAASSNVNITMNPAEKKGIVVSPDQPWEDFRLTSYFNVIQDGDKLRMYYSSFDEDQWQPGVDWSEHAFMCYAESTDGINWTKPDLGLVEYNGSTNNNIIAKNIVDGTVFIDPTAPPEQRYKMLHTTGRTRRAACTRDVYASRIQPTARISRSAIPSMTWNPTASRTSSMTLALGSTWPTFEDRPMPRCPLIKDYGPWRGLRWTTCKSGPMDCQSS